MNRIILTIIILLGMTSPTASGVRPTDLLQRVKEDWKCDACECRFQGLDYAAPVDLRFETKERKNQCPVRK